MVGEVVKEEQRNSQQVHPRPPQQLLRDSDLRTFTLDPQHELIFSMWESEIWEQVSWVVLTWGLMELQ